MIGMSASAKVMTTLPAPVRAQAPQARVQFIRRGMVAMVRRHAR